MALILPVRVIVVNDPLVPVMFPEEVKLVNVPTLVIFGCALPVTVVAVPAELE